MVETLPMGQPQVSSYIPAPQVIEQMPAVMQQGIPQAVMQQGIPQVSSYIPAPQFIEQMPVMQQGIPQVASYIPAAQPVVETYAPQVMTQPQVIETLAPGVAPTVMAAPASYIPAPMVETVQAGAPVVSYVQPQAQVVEAMPSGQSVIVEQVGDWLVCEDALGIFYHHGPTQQSFDNAPPEFLMLFPQGYQPPAL